MEKKFKIYVFVSAIVFFFFCLFFSNLFFDNYLKKNIPTIIENPNSNTPWTEPLNRAAYKKIKGFVVQNKKDLSGNSFFVAKYKFNYFPGEYCFLEPMSWNNVGTQDKEGNFSFAGEKLTLNSYFCYANFEMPFMGWPFVLVGVYLFFGLFFLTSYIYKIEFLCLFSKYIIIINTIFLFGVILIYLYFSWFIFLG